MEFKFVAYGKCEICGEYENLDITGICVAHYVPATEEPEADEPEEPFFDEEKLWEAAMDYKAWLREGEDYYR